MFTRTRQEVFDTRRVWAVFGRGSVHGSWARLGGVMALLVLIAGLGGLALTVRQTQVESRSVLETRFQERGDIAARFAATYVREIFSREKRVAGLYFDRDHVTQQQFQEALDVFGFGAAELLDSRGHLLAIGPPKPTLLGHNVGAKYAHLRAAMAGHVAVSQVVPSAARGVPVVAFATPFDTPRGRRVFSGAFDVGSTPLGAYLHNALPFPGSRIYLIDGAGTVVAGSDSTNGREQKLPEVDRPLAAAMHRRQGTYVEKSIDHYFTVRTIPGTPWRVVLTIPSSILYAAISGKSLWLPWVLFAFFAVGLIVMVWLLLRYRQNRRHLARLNEELHLVARLDALTGVYNRRQLDENLAREVARESRHGTKVGFILLDLDHFKLLNDKHGHQVGDMVLHKTAERLLETVRVVDTVYRYGGEEFAILMPDTDESGALVVAERLRAGIASYAFGAGVTMTVSLGISIVPTFACSAAGVIKAADLALYEAKRRGRNQAVMERTPVMAVVASA